MCEKCVFFFKFKYKKKKEEDLHNNVIDGNVDEFDKETDEAHDGEADGSGESNLLKFF
jgi:hypothetical protein